MNHISKTLCSLIVPITLLVACDANDDNSTEATGNATYQDATSDADGQDVEPATPSDRDGMTVTIEVQGTGSFDVSEPQCQVDTVAGSFFGVFEGEGSVDDDGVYVASMAESEATFTTPSGCTLPTLEIGLVTDIVVRGELPITQQNCTSYCDSKGRAYAEQECSVASDEATCRTEAETEYSASCETSCSEPTTSVIVAETSIAATGLANLDPTALAAGVLGTVEADLTFDRLEDGDGNEVDEAP